jgi:hypothetical protein
MSDVGLRQVGEFTPQRPLVRTVKNPIDKATIVSIYPKGFIEWKPTIQPDKYELAPGSFAEPAVLVVGSPSWWRDVGEDQPLIEIPVSATALANSLITDYCNGLLGSNVADSMPGMFYVNGEFNQFEVKTRFKKALEEANTKQRNWYSIIVKLADSLWARSNGNPLAIWDVMRVAARELGMEKPWLRDYQITEMVKCFACGSLRDPAYPVCPSCKAIDPNHPLAKELKFAQ